MVVAVETLFLTALLSAFIGLISLLALYSTAARGSPRLRGSLRGTVVVATVAAVGSLFLYALSPHEAARQSVYGVAAPAVLTMPALGQGAEAKPPPARL